MGLRTAIEKMQELTGGLVGIKAAPVNPPEGAVPFPFAVAYPRTGTLRLQSATWSNQLHTIWVELHFGRQILPAAIDQALPYVELFQNAVNADPTLGGSVAVVNEVRYTFGKLEWGGVETLGWRFEVDVKIAST
jgi:hypothetical protein